MGLSSDLAASLDIRTPSKPPLPDSRPKLLAFVCVEGLERDTLGGLA